MSRANSGKGRVSFAEERCPSPAGAAAGATATAVPHHLDVSLGLLLVGGIYTTDLLLPEGSIQQPHLAADSPGQPAQLPQAEVRNLSASNLSVSLEPAAPASAGSQAPQQRLVLRLWAEREGPFSADFTLVLPPDHEVGVHVAATVFSRKKGTPGLKPHVRCLGFSADTDTEAASDWQGFE